MENIRFADAQSRMDVRRMWKKVFGDDDAYMELYFGSKYRDENTLVYFHDNAAAASLQMLPYTFTFHGVEIEIAYVMGVCTLPEFRGQGFQDALLRKMLQVLSERNIPLAILVPAEPWLIGFYEKYGFAQTFDAADTNLPSLRELNKVANINEAYSSFDAHFRDADMTVQKSPEDFKVIMREAQLFNFPEKKNLISMSRVIDAEYLLSIFARQHLDKQFELNIEDEILSQNNKSYQISNGEVCAQTVTSATQINIKLLNRLLLGYRTAELPLPFSQIFPEKSPQINFMLE